MVRPVLTLYDHPKDTERKYFLMMCEQPPTMCARRIRIMRRYSFPYFVALALIITFCSCNNPTEPGTTIPIQLIPNSSFEIDGGPSLEGWRISDTAAVRLIEAAPTNGGRWSLRFEASPFPGGYAYFIAPAEQGKHQYRFSLWVKRSGNTLGAAGLSFNPRDTRSVLLNILPISDTVWTFHSFLDTIAANAQDSIRVLSIGGNNEEGPGQSFFDLCKLERLD